MPTPSDAARRPLLAGLIDLTDGGRPPHPGGRPCGSLCVPACTAVPGGDPPTAPRPSREVRP